MSGTIREERSLDPPGRSAAEPGREAADAGRHPQAALPSLLRLQKVVGNAQVQRLIARRSVDRGEAAVPSGVEQGIRQARGGGEALEAGARERMESAFGFDFRGVRVHTDARAHTLNEELSARAFTTGRDIFFRKGEYAPESPAGRELLAHELAHVVQQGGTPPPDALRLGQPGDHLEQEAEHAARAAAQEGASPALGRGSARRIQRVRVPLPGWGTDYQMGTDDNSYMDIRIWAKLWVGGTETRRDFSRGQRERFTVPLGSTVSVQIGGWVGVMRDALPDEYNSWTFFYNWPVTIDARGNVRIAPPDSRGLDGGTGDAPWSLALNPLQGDRSVGMALTLGSVEGHSTEDQVSGTGGGRLTPFGVGVDAEAGYARTWARSVGSTLVSGRGFIVDLDVPEPPPQVEIGPITTVHRYSFFFDTNTARLGRNPASGEDENQRLTRFLVSLDRQGNRGRNLTIYVDGYASTPGGVEYNRDLSRRRAGYVQERIRDTLPLATSPAPRVFGEDLPPELVAEQDHRRRQVVRLEVRTTQE